MYLCISCIGFAQVYYISKAQLKTANKQFSNTNNDYEMNMSAETKIVACDDSESCSVPTIQYKFVTIADLAQKPVGNLVGRYYIIITFTQIVV